MVAAEAGAWRDDRASETVASCDLCGSVDAVEVAAATPDQCRTLLCRRCGLMYASPRLPADTLASFYDDEFTGDAGAFARSAGGAVADAKVTKEERIAREWSFPLVARHLDPAGRRILDLRCRTGALSAALAAAGAEVWAVDPFRSNLDLAAARGLDRLVEIPVTGFETMAPFEDASFDAVVVLSIHVLAHVRSPAAFLARAHALLKPGGLLIIDEKDVLEPHRQPAPSVFASGPVHNFHLTQATFDAYLRRAGFETVASGPDAGRSTAFRHMVGIARRPLTGPALGSVLPWQGEAILRRLRRVERAMPLHRLGLFVRASRRRLRRLLAA
ncbi:MAG: class I SAM-dependent methyltransferase [Alphaproteobacteria bacterium]